MCFLWVVQSGAYKGLMLGWPKSSFGFFHNILQKNLNELSGQPINSSHG